MRCCGRRAAQENILVREMHMSIHVLQPGRLAKADELIMDEAILDVVEHVDVLHNGLTLIHYKVLDKSISADDDVLCCSVRISRRDTLDENLGLVEIKVEASVLHEYMLDVREDL